MTAAQDRAQVPEQTRQRIFRVPIDQGVPEGWRFAQWLGKESIVFPPYWADVVLCEVDDGR